MPSGSGFRAAADDVRHNYERVFYGRETTGNLADNAPPGSTPGEPGKSGPDLYGRTPEQAEPRIEAADLYGNEPSLEERQSTAGAYQHAANAPGVRAEMDSDRPYRYGDAPALEARGADSREALYGPQSAAPSATPAPAPEPPTAQPANDMTPG